MIIERGIWSVANWWFEDRRRSVRRADSHEVSCLLQMCETAAAVLESHNLLKVERVCLVGWVSYNPVENRGFRTELEDVDSNFPPQTNLHDIFISIEEIINDIRNRKSDPYLYPIKLQILGKGEVLNENRVSHWEPDVTWIVGRTSDAHIVDVGTQSDVWMPHTLDGVPQEATWRNNAHRLREALQEIEEKLGVSPAIDDHSDFALIEGFSLTNCIDAFGEVINVLEGFPENIVVKA